MQVLDRISRFIGSTFAYWVLLFAVVSFLVPAGFTWLAAYITPLLGIVMFGMGLTLSIKDFKEVVKRPFDILIGVLAQFIIMPGVAFLLTMVFHVSPEVAVGVILVGCCPGGTSSNVMTFLAKGDTALSVTMSSVTTLLAPIVTPFLIWLLASQWVSISFSSLFISILKIILLPIFLGVIVKLILGKRIEVGIKALPIVSVVAIIAIVSAVVSSNQEKIATNGLLIFALVFLHNGLGLLLGYLSGKLFRMSEPKQRALAFEVGLQNSALGASIATAHFSPLAAVPSAIFSIWHNISGALLANWFSKHTKENVNESIDDAESSTSVL
ncbi:bile acid:sodium symporter family protein [Terrilactibacillus sp. BCM23-1]|uniref:Bile acid:sodium symporter family protein n=1 Tax=Terrilactibacillus tamarindi TaxID=2599694 RepID=A0A6N8CP68_9BACI|nr:bile acid:sodium symporter family protein [Terrilactibacillus tamarindi]MTT31964.1 bile acid:sodium symporter family protein [Terrilactibacillus tamarindi]